MTNTLPDRLHKLIRVAVADLEKVEASSSYVVDMGAWHSGADDMQGVPCAVCFAGAVMAFSLGTPLTHDVDPWGFDNETRGKLRSLNDVRFGNLYDAVDWFYGTERETTLQTECYSTPSYKDDPTAFKAHMLEYADLLEEMDL